VEQLTASPARADGAAGAPAPPSQLLTFRVGSEQYGVPILAVHEIRGLSPITPLPNAPPEIPGVMNLRGTIVPVIDLRVKFGVPDAGDSRFTVIVLVSVGGKIVGMVVDAVVSVPAAEIQPVPDLGTPAHGGFVSGLVHVGDKLVVLLDVVRVLAGDERFAPLAAE
jgi:purine-binding chemotaxis protein CheW